jgi:tetratricopeptide (TPR) repeat protein
MRTVFDHSWKLLTEEEQRVLLRLSAFRGGFRREAAGSVAGATISVLSALMTKSLIRRESAGRYDLHELIRQFAAEQLAEHPDEQTATQACHSKYYLTLFSRATERLQSAAQRQTLAELTVEMDNFRAAWDWAIAHHDFAHTWQVSAMLYHVYELRAWLEEGEKVFHDTLEAIQSHTEATNPDEALTIIHIMRVHLAYFRFRLGKSTVAYAELLSSATFLQSSTDQFAAAYSMWYLGIVCWTLGRFTEAIESLRVSLEKAKTQGKRWHEAAAGEYIGIVMHERGEYERARPYFMDALAIARELGDPMLIAHILAYMSRTIIALGRITEAEAILRESLALAQEIGYRSGIGHALDGLGRLAQITSPDKARSLFAASYGVYKETGDLRNMARVLSHQGYNSLARGDDIDAQNSFIAVLQLVREGGFMPFGLDAVAGLASLQAKQGDREHALELLLVVSNHPASLQETKDRVDHMRVELGMQLTPAEAEAIQAHTGEKTFEAVMEELLK